MPIVGEGWWEVIIAVIDKAPAVIIAVIDKAPEIYALCKNVINVPEKGAELERKLKFLKSREADMKSQLRAEMINDRSKKQKQSLVLYSEEVRKFKSKAAGTLEDLDGLTSRWGRVRMNGVLNELLEEAEDLLKRADQLLNEGLTISEVCTRGLELPVKKLIGETACGLQRDVLNAIRAPGFHIIGIHGNIQAGKTNFMKCIHNDVLGDCELVKAVFWAGAPEKETDAKSIQECIAEAMRFNFSDEDVVRRSSDLGKRLRDFGPGKVVLFLDNVKEDFRMHDVGLPVRVTEDPDFSFTLVFTASSESICNRMRCSAKFKMDLLPENEAQLLFMHEADLLQEDEARDPFLQEAASSNHINGSYDELLDVARNVAIECARMPFVITSIARSMTGKSDIREWRNRLNELKGLIGSTDCHEAKILDLLKFCFRGLKDDTHQNCFLASPKVLSAGRQTSRDELIQFWTKKKLIGKRSRTGVSPSVNTISHQGHAIINELIRVHLLEKDGVEYVSMNEWIRRMAESILEMRPSKRKLYCRPSKRKRNL